jgi:hypothetical protein
VDEALSLHALLRCGQAWNRSQSISALFFNFVLSAEARTLVVAHGRWLGVASTIQRQEVIFDDLLHFDVMLHVGGQEKPSVAAQAQEACTHECGRKSRRTLGQKVPAGIRKARVKVSAVKPWAERWQWTSAFRSSTCLPSALTCEAPAERGARTGSLLAYMLGGEMGAHRSREVLLILCACTLRFGGPRRRLCGLASTCIGHGLTEEVRSLEKMLARRFAIPLSLISEDTTYLVFRRGHCLCSGLAASSTTGLNVAERFLSGVPRRGYLCAELSRVQLLRAAATC